MAGSSRPLHILVLHGQRRVGKTSVLKHIPNRLPDKYIPVFIDLQGRVSTTLGRFLGWLAREETLIALRGRDPLSQPVVLDDTQKKVLGWGSVLGWPLLVGSLAVGLMLRHRRTGGAS